MKDNKIIFKKESNYGHHYDKKKKATLKYHVILNKQIFNHIQ